MPIPILVQVHDEVRRLAIAGSTLAAGDFRLKRLIAPLEQAGAKAPVFARIAQAARELVDSSEKEAAAALLSLSTLVGAVLYTQGQTGIGGELQPLETVDLGDPVTGTNARTLKPIVEALTSTGAGRLEILQDALKRGAFRDMRLIRPAVAAIDDSYSEIGNLIANQVLPMYGKPIYPLLRAAYDPKGRGGQVRRLRLMHRLDSEATAELIDAALESGSKEIKIAAMGCLDHSERALAYLLEQATAKTKDIRRAALDGLSQFNGDDATAALVKALAGRDVDIAVPAAAKSTDPKLLQFILENGPKQLDETLRLSDAKKRSKAIERFHIFLDCFAGRQDENSIQFLTHCFDRRDELIEAGGDFVVLKTARLLVATESKPVLEKLADSHAGLPVEVLYCCFLAALVTQTPERVYEAYSGYLLEVPPKRATKKTSGYDKAVEAIHKVISRLTDNTPADAPDDDLNLERRLESQVGKLLADVRLDSRWLDAAIKVDQFKLVVALGRPEHNKLNQYLSARLKEKIGKRGAFWEVAGTLDLIIKVKHPKATDFYVAAVGKLVGSTTRYATYWLARMVPQLPKEAAPALETLLGSLPESVVDEFAPYLAELKSAN